MNTFLGNHRASWGLICLFLAAASCTSPTSHSSTPSVSIGSLTFTSMRVQLLSFGQSNNAFSISSPRLQTRALTSTTSGASSYEGLVQFALGSGTTASTSAAILGFDVYRSTDDATWTKIGTENYGAATTLSSLQASTFSYADVDPSLALGTTYYYYLKAFDTSGNYSVQSPVAQATFLTPFTLSLTSPSDSSIGQTTAPTLRFTLSSTALWNSANSDYFYFAVLVKDKTGLPCFYGEFRYDFNNGVWQRPASYDSSYGDVGSWSNPVTVSGLSYSGGVISVDLSNSAVKANNDAYRGAYIGESSFQLPTVPLLTGQTYEWDVFGDWWGASYGDVGSSAAMDAAFFVKAHTSGSGTGYGVSFANTYAHGEGSLNGSYSFSD